MKKESDKSKSIKTTFSKPEEVDKMVKDLRKKLGVEESDGKYSYPKGWTISDLRDCNNRQYVDLVQKGGGVWGIALVGFTYVMEELGIRFLRLAGTSAGSINAVLLAAIKNKEDKKSEDILDLLAEKDIFEFVDGHNVVKSGINFILKNKDKLKLFTVIPIIYISFLIIGILYLISPFSQDNVLTLSIFYLISFLLFVLILLIAFALLLYNRMGQAGLGLNPGENFLIWLRRVLRKYNPPENQEGATEYFTTEQLIEKVRKIDHLGLRLIKDESRGLEGLEGDITVITAELVTQNKIELPRMSKLFKSSKSYHPFEDAAEMVRASMAIPLFFESFYARNIDTERNKEHWIADLKMDPPPKECRFVDGGVMSNFPINIYFNPRIDNPRLPTIGIDLEDGDEEENEMSSSSWKIISFLSRLFNASRYYYDKDFILKNDVVMRTIPKVPITGIHWLQFGMDAKQKSSLFMQGAKAAYKFFCGQDWEDLGPDELQIEESEAPVSDEKIVGEKSSRPDIRDQLMGFNWLEYQTLRGEMRKSLELAAQKDKETS